MKTLGTLAVAFAAFIQIASVANAHPHAESCATTIYFGNNVSKLNDQARNTLQKTAKEMRSPTYSVVGFTDGVASEAYNLSLSERRIASVVDYFVGLGIERSRLKTSTARGESDAVSQKSDANFRKVEIIEVSCGGHTSHHIRALQKFGAADGDPLTDNSSKFVAEQ
jgi:outer membrane protein OmpA-like peptidoglycan-associated protein